MSKLSFTFASLAIAAFCGLQSVQAQQPLPGQPISPTPPGTEVIRPTEQQAGVQNDQGDRYEARRVSVDSQSNQHGLTVREAIVQKLQKTNEAEIELAKMAMQRTDNQELKQLAQMIIQDHQQCNQKLQQWGSQNDKRSSQDQLGRNQDAGENRVGNQKRPNKTDQFASRPTGDATGDAQSARVPNELWRVGEQACENALKMTKDMLGNYEGQDFNMAFLGQQCVAHTMMLAELKAIASVGPEELQTFAQETSQKVEQHLEKCKQLAKKLEDDRSKSRS
ncbi:DUF4142 domain-containing protein [Stieleria varia]|uniref:DUF4142 domain-containing protein n=1 Tax=Stieleria varia TaxID=2528005 RepID=A0A5C6B8B9_9BACT|nr:DUF4142 domain-containing protein [Stieleria varia]TWU08515.1 hypothetical protein Pla52n_10980 [Stieleria varia]